MMRRAVSASIAGFLLLLSASMAAAESPAELISSYRLFTKASYLLN